MVKENYNVIGVMSGTSLDGIDLAHIHFSVENGKWNFKILESETITYSREWIVILQSAIGYTKDMLAELNVSYTALLGNIITNFINRHHIGTVDAVCSHGHTILHQPQNHYTLQIGNLPEICRITGQKVVCDFRVQDVHMGGQGAPLVPIGDRILFGNYDYCLNLGGFSNISFEDNGNRIAFDISPVNTVLNFYANRLGFEYDDRGRLSASGKLNPQLLDELNAISFYTKPYPKSLGFEFVKETILPLTGKHGIPDRDIMRTFTEHIAMQIAAALPRKAGSMLVTGGGAYNDFLLERICRFLPAMDIVIPDKKILEFKEALIFALLGVLRLRQEVNVLGSVTGAKHDHSSGIIYG